jgi:hypothetical protein
MTRHQIIASTTALLAALSVAAPVAAQANPLLSGYGGPGQGNQAILGSALLKGGGGGSGGPSIPSGPSAAGSSSSGASVAAAVRGAAGSAALTGARGQGSKASSGASPSASGPSHRRKAERTAVGGPVAAHRGQSPGRPSQPIREGAEYLGLSGGDLLYMLLVLAVLACTGVLTRRLSRVPPDPITGSAKGHGRRVRIIE